MVFVGRALISRMPLGRHSFLCESGCGFRLPRRHCLLRSHTTLPSHVSPCIPTRKDTVMPLHLEATAMKVMHLRQPLGRDSL